MAEFRNQLHYGDNLEVLREKIPDEIADLIYLDPPFNSARNYNLLFKQHKGGDSHAQIVAFEDTWTWNQLEYQSFLEDERNEPLLKLVTSLYDILGASEMMAYVVMMAPRLLELHRKLKPTGSLYLHCDPAASHYLKIILDVIFGPQNFRNEVVWKRSDAHNDAKRYGRIHDTLLFYSKSTNYTWNKVFMPYSQAYLDAEWIALPSGRSYKAENMLDPRKKMPLWDFKGTTARWRTGPQKMEDLWNEPQTEVPNSHGRIKLGRDGKPTKRCRIRFLEEMPGVPLQDLFLDIRNVRGTKGEGEHRGYPTQKPLALLERIIAASSNEGDVILDPFAGCGTSIVAAERMNRKWIGIDITYLAINEVLDRLQAEKVDGKPLVYDLAGTPKDMASAEKLFESTKSQNHKPFEQWAVSLVGGRWNDKKGADRGIDGRIQLLGLDLKVVEVLIQVKGGNALTLSAVRDFANVIESNKALMGIMIAMKPPTKEMKIVCQQMGFADWHSERKYPRYQIVTIEELLEKGVRAEIPERMKAYEGVGKKIHVGQGELEL